MAFDADRALNSSEMEKLETLVEEAARSTEEGVRYFIEPASGTLRRAISKRHHIVFGRRGSGKSSLLRKAGQELAVSRRPIAYVDLEKFKGHTYPDVILSVLISTFTEFKKWLDTGAIFPATKQKFWKRIFGAIPTRSAFNKKKSSLLSKKISELIDDLTKLLHSADDIDSINTSKSTYATDKSIEADAEIKSPVSKIHSSTKIIGSKENINEITKHYTDKKIEFLHRHLLDYQNIFREISELSEGSSYLFLDDLYHLKKLYQPELLDYFHRIAKGNKLWLKIGTIRHRSEYYRPGNPAIGLKTTDDADEIDLDVTLEKYIIARKFLLQILSQFSNEAGLNMKDFLTEGARDRLVLASGGVARDFLTIFRHSIDHARERDGQLGNKGSKKVTAEDVNASAGQFDSFKREDFQEDSFGDTEYLEKEYTKVRDFCLEKTNSNCFLIKLREKSSEIQAIKELVDLKLLHLVSSRVTVSKRPGEIFEAYMLDISQYAGARKKRGLKLIEFWKPTSNLRQVSIIYEPSSVKRAA